MYRLLAVFVCVLFFGRTATAVDATIPLQYTMASDQQTPTQKKLVVRQLRVKEGWRQLLLPNVAMEGDPNKRLMAACVKLYKDLLLLENFAIMNYCGFSKILKKHDKLTG